MQPPKPVPSSFGSVHFPSIPVGQRGNSCESLGDHRDADNEAPVPASASWGCHPGPEIPPLKTKKQQQFKLEKYFVSFQIYLKPRSGLTPILGRGLVFYPENQPPGPRSSSPLIEERTALVWMGGEGIRLVLKIS